MAGPAIIAFCLWARLRRTTLAEGTPAALWTRLAMLGPVGPWLQLAASFVRAVAAVLAPRWRWGVAFGMVWLVTAAVQYGSSWNTISGLRAAGPIEVVEGTVTKADHYVTRRARRESIDVASRRFDYGEFDPGTPYSLILGAPSVKAGQHVRLGVANGRIIRFERRLE